MNSKKVEVITKAVVSAASLGLLKVRPPQPEAFFPGTIAIWCEALSDLDEDAIRSAFSHIMKRRTSPETYGRELLPGDIRAQAEKEVEADYGWQDAWNEIMEKAHAIKYPPMISGEFRKPKLSYPQTEQLMKQMGGPDFFLNLRLDENNTARAQFRNAWQAMTELAPLKPEQQQYEAPPQYIEAPREPLPPELEKKASQTRAYLMRKAEDPQQALLSAGKILADRQLLSNPDSAVTATAEGEAPTPHAARRELIAKYTRFVKTEFPEHNPESQFEMVQRLLGSEA